MTKTRKLLLVVAATFLSALALPGSSSAQFGTQIGEWSGVYSFQTTIIQAGMPPVFYSGGGTATFSLYDVEGLDWEMAVQPSSGSLTYVGGILSPPDPFGPNSASGSLIPFPGYLYGFGNFFVTYESILPDGLLDVGYGSAVADITTIYNTPTEQETTFVSFTTAPEPTSIVHAALAVIVIAVVASMRAFRKRPCARQTSAT